MSTTPEPPKRGRGRPQVLPQDGIRTSTTLPRALHAELTAAALANGRSLDREIAHRLAQETPMQQLVTIAADTDASRLGIILDEEIPRDLSWRSNIHGGQRPEATMTEEEATTATAALDARGIDWGWV